jgi:hypothetical protein
MISIHAQLCVYVCVCVCVCIFPKGKSQSSWPYNNEKKVLITSLLNKVSEMFIQGWYSFIIQRLTVSLEKQQR